MSVSKDDVIERINKDLVAWIDALPERGMSDYIESLSLMMSRREPWTGIYDTDQLAIAFRIKDVCKSPVFGRETRNSRVMGQLEAEVVRILAHMTPIARIAVLMSLAKEAPSALALILGRLPPEPIKNHHHNVVMTLALALRETMRAYLDDGDRRKRVNQSVDVLEGSTAA